MTLNTLIWRARYCESDQAVCLSCGHAFFFRTLWCLILLFFFPLFQEFCSYFSVRERECNLLKCRVLSYGMSTINLGLRVNRYPTLSGVLLKLISTKAENILRETFSVHARIQGVCAILRQYLLKFLSVIVFRTRNYWDIRLKRYSISENATALFAHTPH